MPDYPNSYGLEGFTDKDFSVIIKDRYDLWEFFLERKNSSKNITNGFRKEKTKFRLTRINSIKILEVSTEMQKCIFLPLTKKINNLEFSKRKLRL